MHENGIAFYDPFIRALGDIRRMREPLGLRVLVTKVLVIRETSLNSTSQRLTYSTKGPN